MKAEAVSLDTEVFYALFRKRFSRNGDMDSVFKGELEGNTCELNLAEYFYKACENLAEMSPG